MGPKFSEVQSKARLLTGLPILGSLLDEEISDVTEHVNSVERTLGQVPV